MKKQEYQPQFADILEELEDTNEEKNCRNVLFYNNQPHKKRTYFLKVFVFNFLGIILGLLGGALSYNLAAMLFEWLGKFGFITKLLSWPVDYVEYALTGIFLIDIASSVAICVWLCEISHAKYNYGIIVVSIVNLVRYIYGFALNISSFGFSFDLLFVYIFAFGAIIIAFVSAITNEKYDKYLDNN